MERQELREMFNHFDRDANGVIDFGEFTKLLGALEADMEPPEIKVGFEVIDSNGNGLIDYLEFQRWWLDR